LHISTEKLILQILMTYNHLRRNSLKIGDDDEKLGSVETTSSLQSDSMLKFCEE
jgi:hypothetical protein